MQNSRRQTASKVLAVTVFFIIWYALSFVIAAPLILPYPHAVLGRLFLLVQTSRFWHSLSFTFLRVIIAFCITLVLGTFLGLLCADFPSFKPFVSFPVSIIRATPVIALILVALFWFQSGTVPVFVSVLMTLPVMVSSSEQGFEHRADIRTRLFMAQCYGLTGVKAFRYIRLPAAMPFIFSGAESAFGMSWKVVAAGEVLSIPRYGAGSLMQQAQVHLETADVLAVTAVLVLCSILTQKLLSFSARLLLSYKNPRKNHQKAL